MPGRIRAACRGSGEPVPESDAELVRCVLDSMALAICGALGRKRKRCTGRRVRVLHVVGGGSANRLFLSVLAASVVWRWCRTVEASAVGNLLVQLHAAREQVSPSEMRELVARSIPRWRG